MRSHAKRGVALAILVAAYAVAREPATAAAQRHQLGSAFRFERTRIAPAQPAMRSGRDVHPAVRHIDSWISSVGAAVALADLDGDGLPNEACLVDPRSDSVSIIALPPGRGAQIPPQLLVPRGVSYDARTMAPMGCLPGDPNEDGLLDLVVYYWGRPPLLFQQRASEFVPLEIVADPTERWFSNSALFADIDGDGHSDLVIGNYFPDGARVLDARARDAFAMQSSMSRAYNGGHKHLLRWTGLTDGPWRRPRFAEAAGVLEDDVSRGWTLAMAAGDLDGDLLPELYLANDFGPDRLLHNRSKPGRFELAVVEGRRGLSTPPSKVLGRDSFKGMGVELADIDGDGHLDIYVSNIAAEFALMENHLLFVHSGDNTEFARGVAPYVDRSEPLGLARSGWAWDARLADFDNDGVLEAVQATGFVRGDTNRWAELQELATGNDALLASAASWPRVSMGDDLSGRQHNPFFVRGDDGRYVDVALDLGLTGTEVSRGIALADVDGDGDLDMAVANQWDDSFYFENQCSGCAASVGLHVLVPLEPVDATLCTRGHPARGLRARPAHGASVTLARPDGSRAIALVDGGSGHSGKRSADVMFGLGARHDGREWHEVTIRWRDPEGVPREESLRVATGWNTVVLAWPGKAGSHGSSR